MSLSSIYITNYLTRGLNRKIFVICLRGPFQSIKYMEHTLNLILQIAGIEQEIHFHPLLYLRVLIVVLMFVGYQQIIYLFTHMGLMI